MFDYVIMETGLCCNEVSVSSGYITGYHRYPIRVLSAVSHGSVS